MNCKSSKMSNMVLTMCTLDYCDGLTDKCNRDYIRTDSQCPQANFYCNFLVMPCLHTFFPHTLNLTRICTIDKVFSNRTGLVNRYKSHNVNCLTIMSFHIIVDTIISFISFILYNWYIPLINYCTLLETESL